jgi:diguanylate cyclase (GGDEF)-like protein
LPLRSAFIEAAMAAIDSARSSGDSVSILVIDIDHFKLVNDTFGHLQGDDVLVEVADILRGNLRGYDLAARYAGDEFVALLPNTGLEGADEVAQRICSAVRSHNFRRRDGGGNVPITLSIGVAAFPAHGETTEVIFGAADRALYQVKRQGRDGVAVATDEGAPPAHLPLSIGRFVGRVEELRSLVRLLEDAATGRPKVVAITGEAGIGKSTLIKQLGPEVRLRAGSLVTGRCHAADVQPPYAPWSEAINAIRRMAIAPERAWRELPQLVPALTHAEGPAQRGGSKYLLLEEIAEFIRLAAQATPLVIVLDDMQWADSASWDTLEYLIPQLENERLLICLSIRAEETYGETLERRRRLSRNEIFHELTLARLTRDEMKQWMEAAFHRQDVGRELLAFLYRHTEGNPLFVVQVLRTLLDEGAIWYAHDRWEWRPVSELRLPVAVSDLISRRLSRLSPKSQAVLTTAAVIGREFDLDLAMEAGAGTEEELLDAIDEGLKASVLQVSSERESDRYAWSHGKMAEVLRDAVNPRRLRRIHERVAQALERRTPEALSEIATHYDRGGNAAEAYRYALSAAEQARAVYAHQEGTEFLRIAERNAGTPEQLAEVRVRLARIAEIVGRYDEAEELCDLAIEWYSGRGEARRALSLRRMRERLRALLGQPARQTLDACLLLDQEAQQLGDDSERVSLLMMISQTYERLGDRQAAEDIARECVRMAESLGGGTLLADALNRLGVTLEPDDRGQAMEIYNRALEIYREAGDARGEARCHNNLGIVHTHACEWDQARAELTTAIALARTTGTADLWGLAALNLGVASLKIGDFDHARELFGEGLALFAGVKNSERQLYALYNLAHLDRQRGVFDSAAELYEAAASLAQRIGQSDVEIGATAGAGLSLLEQGRTEEARVRYGEAVERLQARKDWFQGRELVEALGVRLDAAANHLQSAVDQFRDSLTIAESGDIYSAAWLTAECASTLALYDKDLMRSAVGRYSADVKRLGFADMSRRYEEILERTK